VELQRNTDVGFDRSELILNDANVISPTSVQNGDRLRVLVCAPTVGPASEIFTLAYGEVFNTISVHTLGVVTGVATVEGYSVDTFGDHETVAFAKALSELLNVQLADIKVSKENLLRRSLLVHTPEHVGLDYDIAVSDTVASDTLKADIKAVQPSTLVSKLNERGLNVTSASMTVVESAESLAVPDVVVVPQSGWNITTLPGTCAMVPSPQTITVEGLAEGVSVKAELFPAFRSNIVVTGSIVSRGCPPRCNRPPVPICADPVGGASAAAQSVIQSAVPRR